MDQPSSRLLEDFRKYALHPQDELEGALLISRFVDPGTDERLVREHLLGLATRIGPGASAEKMLAVLRLAGYAGAESYFEARNSALSHVVRAQRGIPISLAALIIGVARLLDLAVEGINFPGHFLVRLERQLVDPFTLQVLDREGRAQHLAAAGVRPDAPLPVADARTMVLRMLNNLLGIANGQGDYARALECTDLQLLLAPGDHGLRLVRAELWQKLGVTGMVRAELEAALALAREPGLRSRLSAMLQELPTQAASLH